MVALVSVETVLLVVLVVLVAGLLRSHAEIMRRLGPGEDAPDGAARLSDSRAPVPAAARDRERVSVSAPELAGVTPDGDAVKLAFEGVGAAPTLLAFLTSGCGTCATFWETLGERRLPAGVRTVIVTHGPERERPAQLRSLGPTGIPVVMTSEAWADYEIPGAPYFVMVDQAIRGEGVATTWRALASLVSDAIEDQRDIDRAGAGAGAATGERRAERIDETFAAAGIGPDHPSLYPDRRT